MNRFDKLAKALNCTPSLLYKCVKFQTVFSSDEVKQLTDWGLPWQTILVTFAIGDPARRWAALRQEADDRLGCVQFRRKMREQFGSPHPHGGRKPKTPRKQGPDVALRDLLSLGQQWLRYYNNAWLEKNCPTFDRLTASKLSGHDLVSLERLEKSLNDAGQNILPQMLDSCARLRGSITSLRERVSAGLRDRKAGQGTSSGSNDRL